MKIDHDSAVNQEIKGRLVAGEVLTCFSYEMEAILKASAELPSKAMADLPDYEDIENLYQYKCPECGDGQPSMGDFGQETENPNEFHCPSCDAHFATEPEQTPQEILEWWIVSDWLAGKLSDKGEPVLEWGNNWFWGRTCSGQAILLDGVISGIAEEMEILEGQKNDWRKNK